VEPLAKQLEDAKKRRLRRQAEGIDRRRAGLVTVECPRCSLQTRTRNMYAMLICECHWLLRVEPFGTIAVVDDVMEIPHETPPWLLPTPEGKEPMKPNPGALCTHCGLFPNQEAMAEGTKKILESWHRRHLLTPINEDGQRGIRFPSHTAVYEEK